MPGGARNLTEVWAQLLIAGTATALGAESWAALKYVAGAVLTAEALVLVLVPAWRLPGSGVHIGVDLLWLVSLRYGAGPSIATLAARCASWLTLTRLPTF